MAYFGWFRSGSKPVSVLSALESARVGTTPLQFGPPGVTVTLGSSGVNVDDDDAAAVGPPAAAVTGGAARLSPTRTIPTARLKPPIFRNAVVPTTTCPLGSLGVVATHGATATQCDGANQ